MLRFAGRRQLVGMMQQVLPLPASYRFTPVLFSSVSFTVLSQQSCLLAADSGGSQQAGGVRMGVCHGGILH